MNPIELPKVTLIIADTINYGRAIHSLKRSLKQVTPSRVIFFTDIEVGGLDRKIELIKIPTIKNKEAYSKFILKDVSKYIETEFVLITQWDGFILDGSKWLDEFMDYDYIGAPWMFEHGRNIGNGGFSLRSKKLIDILATDPMIDITSPEDQCIGIIYRPYLEKTYGIKFPNEELADQFSYELKSPIGKTFGFHGQFHEAFTPVVVITRKDAMGDVIQTEPILHHFHKKGYRVVLDTLPQFYGIFSQHYFKVYHPKELDARLYEDCETYNLDMTYESNPKTLHLKSYYDCCGIPEDEREYRNPKLNLYAEKTPENRLFKEKYCVIHIDKRGGGRDIQGSIDWKFISTYLSGFGYTIVQIGKGEHDVIPGAIQFSVPTELMLMWLIRDAELFIGSDSGPSNIAVGFNIPSAIFFGSVEPTCIHADLSNIQIIQHVEGLCRSFKCWHSEIGTQGVDCVEDVSHPPCVQYTTEQVLKAVNIVICK